MAKRGRKKGSGSAGNSLYALIERDFPGTAHASAAQRRVQKEYPEVFAESSITYSTMREWIVAHKGSPCRYCNAPGTEVDHKVPLSRGGKHEFDNLEMICRKCNTGKWDMTVEEYLEHISNQARKLGLI